MGIKHKAVKASDEKGYAIEWNDEHVISGDVDFLGFNLYNVDYVQLGDVEVSGTLDMFNAPINMDAHQIINLAEPVNLSDAATKNYVDTQAGPTVGAPIGSLFAWLKNFAGTPPLPSGWVECSGQALSDAGSPYNGQVIPNLNGGGRFLRGATTSGGIGGATSNTTSLARHGQQMGLSNSHAVIDGGDHLRTTSQWTVGTTNYPLIKPSTGSFSILPPYYNVIWIMRVK